MKKIKRLLLMLCVLTCVFSLTACGEKKNNEKPTFEFNEETYFERAKEYIQPLLEMKSADIKYYSSEEYKQSMIDYYQENGVGFNYEEYDSFTEQLNMIKETKKECGNFVDLYYDKKTKDVQYKVSKDYKKEILTYTFNAKYEKRDVKASVVFVFENGSDAEIKINLEPKYTLGETMKKALTNTLIGISTVILVLLFLSILISFFKYISKFQNWLENRKNKKDGIVIDSTENTLDTVEEEEELVDDTELVAVITAAIAASETVSAEGFVVRSIKRAKRK